MRFGLDEQQQLLQQTARRFLEANAPTPGAGGFDVGLWRRLSEELMWPAWGIPEAYGGLGGDFVGLATICEELGRVLYAGPFFSSICLGASAVMIAGTPEQQRRWLPSVASGERLLTLALAEEACGWDVAGVTLRIERHDGCWQVQGEKHFVPDGAHADVFVVYGREPAGGAVLALVEAGSEGVSLRPHETLDDTRSMAAVSFRNVRVPQDQVLAIGDRAREALESTIDRAAVALAAEQVGGAERCLEMAVSYAKVREQFGRPIGSFQAIKHMCADMLLQVESARSAALYAAWAVDEAPEKLGEASALAQAYCGHAFFVCAGQNIQIHGGIGFTWEHSAHRYFKRARSSATLLGETASFRASFEKRIGL